EEQRLAPRASLRGAIPRTRARSTFPTEILKFARNDCGPDDLLVCRPVGSAGFGKPRPQPAGEPSARRFAALGAPPFRARRELNRRRSRPGSTTLALRSS